MPGPVPATVRAAIEAELLAPHTPPRSRAAIAREHGVSTRTVSRFAEDLGLDNGEPFKTDTIREATRAATDRRRAQRSAIADVLLGVEVPRLFERMAADMRKRVVVPGMDARVEDADEDDAVIARGLKDLHAAMKTAVDQSIAIDKTDTGDGDDAASLVLDSLFAGLAGAADIIRARRTDEETTP